jgi:hypothetical protein
MNEPDFEPKTAWQLYLLPGLAFILAILLIVLAALQAPALAEARSVIAAPTGVTVYASACPEGDDVPACAYPQQAIVYVAPGQGRFVLEHELGHVFDYQRLTPGDRNWFTRMLGLTGVWSQGTGMEGLHSPAERFADAYATCALGWRPDGGQWAVAYGYDPTPRQHRLICAAISRVGSRPA